jgi:hypothetical protein
MARTYISYPPDTIKCDKANVRPAVSRAAIANLSAIIKQRIQARPPLTKAPTAARTQILPPRDTAGITIQRITTSPVTP